MFSCMLKRTELCCLGQRFFSIDYIQQATSRQSFPGTYMDTYDDLLITLNNIMLSYWRI